MSSKRNGSRITDRGSRPRKRGIWRKVGKGLKIAGKVGIAVAGGSAAPEIIEAVSTAAGDGAQVLMPADPLADAITRVLGALVALALLLLRRPQDDAREPEMEARG